MCLLSHLTCTGDREPSSSGKLLAGVGINILNSTEDMNSAKKSLAVKWELPKLSDIDPELMRPIPDSGNKKLIVKFLTS